MITRDFSRCPRCGAHTEKAIAWLGNPSEFWYECSNPGCNTFINTYMPQPHQEAVHRDAHTYVLNAGGYGTGKTTTTREEIYKHLFLTPGGQVLVGARIQPQYEQTIKRELEMDIPKKFVAKYNTQKQYMQLINGSRIMYRPLEKPGDLRSLNLSMFVIVEASETKEAAFNQLQTRLRNLNATVISGHDEDGRPIFECDWRKGILESNPDSGYIRSQFLLRSDSIVKHGPIKDTYALDKADIVNTYATHVAATQVNKYLPPDFISNLEQSKPTWWLRRYLYGSFNYSEGLVYPDAINCVVESYHIPPHWKRIVAHDYGLSDPSTFIFGAIDEERNKIVIYKELVLGDKDIKQLAHRFKLECKDIAMGCWYTQPIIDPKSGPKRDYQKKTLGDYYADEGIHFKPGVVSKDTRIFRTSTYIGSGMLEIFDTCTTLIGELKEYKFKLDTNTEDGYTNKPVDKNDHCISALEWILCDLPSDPNKLVYGIYNRQGYDMTSPQYRPQKEITYADTVFQTQPKQSYEHPYEMQNLDFY